MIQRIVRERRRLVVPLAFATGINIVLSLFVVYPVRLKVAADEGRAGASREALRRAEAEFAHVNATIDRRDRARKDLAAFYGEVLPDSVERASQAELALVKQATSLGLKPGRMEWERGTIETSELTRLSATLPVEGNYRSIRSLIHQVEASPHFIVIDSVALMNADDRGGPLRLTLTVSTYFRSGNEPQRDVRRR